MKQFLRRLGAIVSSGGDKGEARNMDDWFDLVVQSLNGGGFRSVHSDPLPGFPEPQLQFNTTGLDGVAALRQAYCFYADIVDGIETSGGKLSHRSVVLDFGVGWGRIARFFLHQVPLKNIHGVDVDPEFVQLCRTLFNSENFYQSNPMPPTALSGRTFDLITAYSVFSHLSEHACLAWLTEFSRLLKPGGYFAFTTRHESFFDYLEYLRDNRDQCDEYSRALGELFSDLDAARESYARGEFVHASSPGVSGGGVRNESFYGESFIPADYVVEKFTANFDLVCSHFDPKRYDQLFYLLRKK